NHRRSPRGGPCHPVPRGPRSRPVARQDARRGPRRPRRGPQARQAPPAGDVPRRHEHREGSGRGKARGAALSCCVTLILDTGPIVAALNAEDPDHAPCAALLADADDLLIPSPILVEVDYWLVKLGGTQVWVDFVA